MPVPSPTDAAKGWRSDKACLERTLDAEQLCWRGTWLHGRFKYREARRYLLQVPQSYRDAELCRLLLADTYRREGQFVREAETYEQLLRSSSNPHWSLLYAISLVRSGRFRQASQALDAAPQENANTHYYRCLCGAAAGDFGAAARHARNACRLAPESAEACYRRLSCCWRAGEYLQLGPAFVAFWKASAMTAPEPLELVDLPNVRAASECAHHRSDARVIEARGDAWDGRKLTT